MPGLQIFKHIYVYTKRITMCPPGYHHNGFMATPVYIHVSFETPSN